jgi:hypothetical protein
MGQSILSGEKTQTWWLDLDHAGYFGKYVIGILFQYSDQQEATLSMGTSFTAGTPYGQINAAYRFTPWLYPTLETHLWKPIQLGVFGIFSLNDGNYFWNSPDKYPSPGYYDNTRVRSGGEVGTCYRFETTGIEVAYRLRLIDLGTSAVYNNAHRDLQYYVSSGLEFHYHFK